VCDTLCVCVRVRVRVYTYTHIGVRISIHQVYVVKLHSVGKVLEGVELQRFRQRVENRAENLEVCASLCMQIHGSCIHASCCDNITVRVCFVTMRGLIYAILCRLLQFTDVHSPLQPLRFCLISHHLRPL